MVRTQIQLTEEQVHKLKKHAEARHISVAELIRQAVDKFIRDGNIIDVEEKRRRAASAAGRLRSGISDLSTRHDEYFSEALK